MRTGIRKRMTVAATVTTAMLTAAALAAAQSGEVAGQASGAGKAQTELAKSEVGAEAGVRAEARTRIEAKKRLDAIRQKGAKASAKARADAEAKLAASAKQVDREAEAGGQVASRLAVEFGLTADAVAGQKEELDASWGELMIAHTLDANAASEITVAELFQLRSEGLGWGQIAAGLGLSLGDVVSAVRAETRVATGLARADGRVHAIHGAGAGVGLGAGASVGSGVNAKAGVGVGVDLPTVKVGKP